VAKTSGSLKSASTKTMTPPWDAVTCRPASILLIPYDVRVKVTLYVAVGRSMFFKLHPCCTALTHGPYGHRPLQCGRFARAFIARLASLCRSRGTGSGAPARDATCGGFAGACCLPLSRWGRLPVQSCCVTPSWTCAISQSHASRSAAAPA
jgi:hypothetical protein